MHVLLHLTRPLLPLDSPDYPDALGASSCAMQLYERFRPGEAPPKSLGPSRDYNVDMVPKFIMNSGELVRGPCMRCPCEAMSTWRLGEDPCQCPRPAGGAHAEQSKGGSFLAAWADFIMHNKTLFSCHGSLTAGQCPARGPQ